MAPSFRDGQVFLMSRLRNHASLRRGDVVVLALDGETYIKRVWALAGDAVRGMDWQEVAGNPDHLVSGTQEFARLRDLARRAPRVGRVVELTVPPGHAFVVGDAAEGSYDSRHFGPVPLTAVKGRVVVPSLLASFRGNANGHGVRAAIRSPGLEPAPAAPRRRP